MNEIFNNLSKMFRFVALLKRRITSIVYLCLPLLDSLLLGFKCSPYNGQPRYLPLRIRHFLEGTFSESPYDVIGKFIFN